MTPGRRPTGHLDRAETLDAARRRFDSYLRANGLRMTTERSRVLEEVVSSQDHFDIRGILRRMRARGGHASRATIYRTIDLLVSAKLLSKLDFGDGEAHFEFLPGRRRHEHLVCTRCGRIIEFSADKIERMLGSIAREYRFEAESHHVQIYGRCSRCIHDADA